VAVRPALEVAAYVAGWRLRSEVLTRSRRQVDFDAGWLRLDAHEAKTVEALGMTPSPVTTGARTQKDLRAGERVTLSCGDV
jgi:hypothetical protein